MNLSASARESSLLTEINLSYSCWYALRVPPLGNKEANIVLRPHNPLRSDGDLVINELDSAHALVFMILRCSDGISEMTKGSTKWF